MCILTATTVICNPNPLKKNAENSGVIESPIGGQVAKFCLLRLLNIPKYSMIEIAATQLNLPLTCCPNTSPRIRCNSIFIEISGNTESICNSSYTKPVYIYNEKAPYMDVKFLTTSFAAGHGFKLTYKGKLCECLKHTTAAAATTTNRCHA